MKTALLACFAWGLCAEIQAADPPAPSKSSSPAQSVLATTPAPARKLDLRIGAVRKYMMPNEYRAALGAPDADKDAIVVEADRVLLPVKSEQPIPSGMPLLPLWWAATHPSQSWRILLPDLNRPPDGPTWDKVPPPVFRWGP